jgi:hypothetical protein
MNRAERRSKKKGTTQEPTWKRSSKIPQRPAGQAPRGGKSLVRRVSQEKGRGS